MLLLAMQQRNSQLMTYLQFIGLSVSSRRLKGFAQMTSYKALQTYIHTKSHSTSIFMHSFICSGYFYSASSVHYYSEALPAQHEYCAGVSRRSTTGNCELRTCPRSLYVAARTGFEPMTLRTKGDESANEPPRPTNILRILTRCTKCFEVCYICTYSLLNRIQMKGEKR